MNRVIFVFVVSFLTVYRPQLTATPLEKLKDSLGYVKTTLTDLSKSLGSLTKSSVVTSPKKIHEILNTTSNELVTLKEVVLEGKKLTEVPDLTSLTEATTVDLSANSINTSDAITNLSKRLPPKVKYLDLSYNFIGKVESIKALKNLPETVTYLDLSYNLINEPDRIAALEELPKNIKVLDLTANLINQDDKIKELKNLPRNITHLILSDSGIDNNEKIKTLLENLETNITYLDISNNTLGKAADIQALAKLPKTVKYLDISENDIDPAKLSDIIKKLPNSIETLNMKNNKNKATGKYPQSYIISGKTYKIIGSSGKHEGIYKREETKSGKTDQNKKNIRNLLGKFNPKNLKQEHYSGNLEDIKSIRLIFGSTQRMPTSLNLLPNLETISFNFIGNENIQLPEMNECKKITAAQLEFYDREYKAIPAEDLKVIKTIFKQLPTTIKQLKITINKTPLTQEITSILTEVPANITRLDLTENTISPEGSIEVLSKLPSTIEQLNIKGYKPANDQYHDTLILSDYVYSLKAKSGQDEGLYIKTDRLQEKD